LQSALKEGEGSVVTLEDKVTSLTNEMSELQREVERKQQELRAFSTKTDEYIRKRERQQTQAHERKMTKLREEFEKRVTQLTKKKDELKAQLVQLRGAQGLPTSECGSVDEPSSGRATPSGVSDDLNVGADAASTISDGGQATGHPQFDQLAQILDDKDDEIDKLKAQLREALAASVRSVIEAANEKEMSPELSHHRATVSSDAHRRGSQGEQRLCRKATLVDKWHDIVNQLTSPRAEKNCSVAERSSSVDMARREHSSTPAEQHPVSTGGSPKDKRHDSTSQQRASTSRRAGSEAAQTTTQRGSRSPSRTSTASGKPGASDKRPAWKH